MKIMFMGTPPFALPTLNAIINEHNICCVITQPDKPRGRGHKLQPTPVKQWALEHNIPVYQPQTLKDNSFLPTLQQYNPDLILVIAYGKILPNYILNFPQKGCINLHGSLLPKYRGAAPIQWAVINGEKQTGVCTMYMVEELDAGDILESKSLNILPNETSGELFERLSHLGAETVCHTLKNLDNIAPKPQNSTLSTYATMLTPQMAEINWNNTAEQIVNFIHGLNPAPVARMKYKEEILKVYKAKVSEHKTECLCFKAQDKYVEFLEIQLPGKRKMLTSDFLRGRM